MTGYNTTQNQKIASRAIISALVLWLAFSGVAAAEQLYVNESGWWRDGGVFYVSGAPISAAVGAASEGDAIYVHGGRYYVKVNVNKERLTLEGEGADVVTAASSSAASGDHVFVVTADYVNISGFAVEGATDSGRAGIYLDNADYCNISGNRVHLNYRGIRLYSSSNNTLTGNIVSNNRGGGIYLDSSSNNTLTNNTVSSNNGDGIFMGYSSNHNTLTDNIVSGIYLDSSSNNTLTGNIVSGIRLYSSSNNTLTDNTVSSNSRNGIDLRYSSNHNMLTNNTVNSNKWTGIFLGYSSNHNMLTNNAVNSNDDGGIFLGYSSNNTLTDNTVSSNNRYDGIRLYSSSNNLLTNNTVSSNTQSGIDLHYSSNHNTLTGNTVNSNSKCGIALYNADNNDIICNWVQSNAGCGFYIHDGSTGNNISYNNIVENGNYNTSTDGWDWQFYNNQPEAVGAKHNYWGAGMTNNTIDASIYDDEEGWGEVAFYPFETDLVTCPLTPEESHTFTTADAVIALQIAAGSRPSDLCWDVSGDGSVTSLDALMIMQAVVGGIAVG